MIKSQKMLLSSLITAAVLNKYGKTSCAEVEPIVARIIDAVRGDTESQLISRLRPVRDLVDDVSNQTIVLTLIERNWSNPPKLEHPLTMLNNSSFGRIIPSFRTRDYVEDFGREVPTPRSEIPARLDELERLSQQSVCGMNVGSLADKALILAHIIGSLIRVHPFEDGNGRTARLFTFYALQCWRLPLFPIPKVRNDAGWKDAMDSAVAGNASKLKNELVWRMEEAVNSCDSDEG